MVGPVMGRATTVTESDVAAHARSRARRGRVHPVVESAAAYVWRLLVIAALVVAGLWLTDQLRVVVIPVVVAFLLTRALAPVASRLRARGLRPGLAAIATLLAFLLLLLAALTFAGATFVSQLDELSATLSEGFDDVEDWLVDSSPVDIERADVERLREQAGNTVEDFFRSGDESLLSGALVAFDVVVGALLTIIITFFFVKDGRRMKQRFIGALPQRHRDLADRVAARSWDVLGGFLRGAALMGLVEAIAIGITLVAVGAGLVAPVMLLTFIAAFIPIVGAVAAGSIAVLVALATDGTAGAIIVAAVAIIIQQLDSDLLAPLIYGRVLRLHPLVVLLGIAAAGSLFGFVGTALAVPFLAVTINAVDEIRRSTSNSTPNRPPLTRLPT